jgi:hypothetical protein
VFFGQHTSQGFDSLGERITDCTPRGHGVANEARQTTHDGITCDVASVVTAHAVGHRKDGNSSDKAVFVILSMTPDVGNCGPAESQVGQSSINWQRNRGSISANRCHDVPLSAVIVRSNHLESCSMPRTLTSLPAPFMPVRGSGVSTKITIPQFFALFSAVSLADCAHFLR